MAAMTELALADREGWHDLATYVGRARRVDPDGAARLVAEGGVLATYVSPVHGSPGPTVIGLRVAALDGAADLDVTVPLAALGDRLAGSGPLLAVPPVQVSNAGWAGVTPPRAGWELVTGADPAALVAAARDGVEEIAHALPEAAGGHVVAQVRGAVWGRELAGLPGVPAGAAYAADALGFLDSEEAVAVRRRGPWCRLSTSRGHVLARSGGLL
jgi:hypothetical protein